MEFHLQRTLAAIEAEVRKFRVFVLGDDEPLRKATVDVDATLCYEAFRLDEAAAPVRRLRAALETLGRPAKLAVGQGGSDANVFNSRGLPTANLGCGMHGVHSPEERASLPEMVRTVETLYELVTNG